MREVKKHWVKDPKTPSGVNCTALCGQINPKRASKKRAVTCKNCQRILAGYTGESK